MRPSKQYSDNYKLIDWSNTPKSESPKKEKRHLSHGIMPDIKEFRSPIDGAVISSRSHLRDHEKRHNIIQVGDEFEGKWNKPKPVVDGPKWEWTE